MKNVIYFLLIAISLISCDDNEPIDCCTVVDIGILIKYVDQNGDNIIDKTNGIESSKIKIFHHINNDWVLYYDSNMDVSKGFKVIEINGENYISVFPSDHYIDHQFSETRIQFSDNDFDQIRTEFDFSHGNTICTKVWYNEALVWDHYHGERKIEVKR
ncbi:MAG: hypothetical protein OEM04_06070 [Flavobacteriaceae bacterium]|nr:hypothetical protein [Flavobacteriaceae bacterium]